MLNWRCAYIQYALCLNNFYASQILHALWFAYSLRMAVFFRSRQHMVICYSVYITTLWIGIAVLCHSKKRVKALVSRGQVISRGKWRFMWWLAVCRWQCLLAAASWSCLRILGYPVSYKHGGRKYRDARSCLLFDLTEQSSVWTKIIQ